MNWLTDALWSPYVVGAGIGLLSWVTWLISNESLGTSTTYVRLAGMVENVFRGTKAEQKLYYQETKPKLDWQMMLVIGIVIGALISSLISGDFSWQWTHPIWEGSFGTNIVVRLVVAFAGGIFLGLGSRWADGCTSGHGISGTMQLAVSGWVSAVFFFVGGILTAQLMFNVIP